MWSLSIILYADEGQITQILINLVKNAVQADARNVVITAQLTPSEQTVISVTNDGLPISRESQDEISETSFLSSISCPPFPHRKDDKIRCAYR